MNGRVCTKSRVKIALKVTSRKQAGPSKYGLRNITLPYEINACFKYISDHVNATVLLCHWVLRVVLHLSDTSFDIDWENATLLYNEDDWYSRLVLESSCVAMCPNFNNMRSTMGIDQFSARLILKSCPDPHLICLKAWLLFRGYCSLGFILLLWNLFSPDL